MGSVEPTRSDEDGSCGSRRSNRYIAFERANATACKAAGRRYVVALRSCKGIGVGR